MVSCIRGAIYWKNSCPILKNSSNLPCWYPPSLARALSVFRKCALVDPEIVHHEQRLFEKFLCFKTYWCFILSTVWLPEEDLEEFSCLIFTLLFSLVLLQSFQIWLLNGFNKLSTPNTSRFYWFYLLLPKKRLNINSSWIKKWTLLADDHA